MAITATLVSVGHNRVRYFVNATAGNETVFINTNGSPSPDLLTDTIGGPLKTIVKTRTQGYGLLPVGAPTTDPQARALLLSENAASIVGPALPTAIMRAEQVTGTPRGLYVDTAVSGGNWQVTVSASIIGSWYVTIEVPSAIGT